MLKKIRELKTMVAKAGYVLQSDRGKGSHTRMEKSVAS